MPPRVRVGADTHYTGSGTPPPSDVTLCETAGVPCWTPSPMTRGPETGPPSKLSKFMSPIGTVCPNSKVDESGGLHFPEVAKRQPGKEFSSNSAHLVIQILVPTQTEHHSMSLEDDWVTQTDITNTSFWGVRLN